MTPKPTENPITVLEKFKEEFKNELKYQNYSENTVLAYEREINYFIEYFREFQEEMDILDINRPFIQKSINFREEYSKKGKISANTKKMYIKALFQFFIYITEAMKGTKDFTTIFRKIKIQTETKEKEYLTETEIKRLLNYIMIKENKKMSYTICRNILMLKILLYTGMRASEVLNIKISDLKDFDEDKNVFQIKTFGKGKKEAFCYIDKSKIEDNLEKLLKFKKQLNITSEYIFVSKNNRLVSRTELYLVTAQFLKNAGISKRGVHIFRHTLGFHLAQKGVRIEDIQEILRHSNLNTTKIYIQRREQDKVNGIKKIDY